MLLVSPSKRRLLPGLGRALLASVLAATIGFTIIPNGYALAEPEAASIATPRSGVTFSTPPEDLAPYVGQVSCESTVKPGTLALKSLLAATYGTTNIGTLRACAQGEKSEHKDGRALDWMLNVTNPSQKAIADSFLVWALGPDSNGVVAGNARRLGIMYLIWNRQTWQSWTGAWKPYSGSSPHTDHIHISLSWDGAMKRTSWWTGVAVTRFDYGPCRLWVGETPPRYTAPRYTPCPAPVWRVSQAFPRYWDGDLRADIIARNAAGDLLLYSGNGAGGVASKRIIGNGWGAMNVITSAGDFDKDGRRDIIGRDTAGRLVLYRGNGIGGFYGAKQIGNGWSGMDVLLGVGDLDNNGTVDVLARRASNGEVLLYPGNGVGGFGTPSDGGYLSSQRDLITAVGDWDGDRQPDVVSRDGSGNLYLHAGNGRGRIRSGEQIGTGWGTITALVGTGDFSGDGRSDLLARRADGSLWLYRGNGAGGFSGSATAVGPGWAALYLVG